VAATGAYLARPYVRRRLRPELDLASPLGVAGEAEMSAIVALGETVCASAAQPPLEFFRDFANSVTQSQQGYLKEYQRAVLLLNRASAEISSQGEVARPFADLPRSRRDQVLHALLWQYSGHDAVTPRLEKLVAARDAVALRLYVVEPLIDHYYRSPYGWAVVGYKSSPGRPPPDPRAYTRPLGSA
jgi:hypothetical protein